MGTAATQTSERPSAVVLLPGNMCDAQLWDGVRADLRIAGWRSVDADTTRDETISSMAARALASADGPLVPVGFSMGGIIALEMSRQAPSRIVGLALLDTNPGADLPERAAARPAQQRRVRDGQLQAIVRDELKPVYLANVNRDNTALKEFLLDMALKLGPDVFVQQSEALRTRRDNWDVLPGIRCPALVACGAEDALCPPDWHRRIAQAMPQSELHVVERSGHMLPVERPDALRELLLGYLATMTDGA